MRLWDLVYLRLPNFSHSYTRHVSSFTQVMCLLFCQPVQTSHPLALVYFLLQRFMGFQKPVPTGFAPSQTTSTIWRTLNSLSMFEHVWAHVCINLSIFRITSLSPMLLMFQVPCGTGVWDARSSTPRTCWTLPSSVPSWAPAAWAPWCWWVATSLSNVTSFAVFPSRKTHSYNMLQYVTICYNMLQYVTICYNMLQYVTMNL